MLHGMVLQVNNPDELWIVSVSSQDCAGVPFTKMMSIGYEIFVSENIYQATY